MHSNHLERTAKEFSEISGLPQTSSNILVAIAKEGKLLISEIAQKIKKSERIVRKHVRALLEKGFLERKIKVTRNNKLAYNYSLKSINEIVKILRKDMMLKLNRVNDIAKGIEE
ncbi:MAG: hypothetical protein COS08_04750 [Euryarchaeota archaeon CG01_land_8_20_14_3_00_38_12]|nr:MAG: hypothetical protein COS08_04750 [Euryarchaeota archaeon CG01_land_8_20_14_3_00_38_12]PJB21782.1 MAG: hypothetical protein CO114_03525 [Euryarchaeota archaeon CG_4_9_14_3_um_filter_38_12]